MGRQCVLELFLLAFHWAVAFAERLKCEQKRCKARCKERHLKALPLECTAIRMLSIRMLAIRTRALCIRTAVCALSKAREKKSGSLWVSCKAQETQHNGRALERKLYCGSNGSSIQLHVAQMQLHTNCMELHMPLHTTPYNSIQSAWDAMRLHKLLHTKCISIVWSPYKLYGGSILKRTRKANMEAKRMEAKRMEAKRMEANGIQWLPCADRLMGRHLNQQKIWINRIWIAHTVLTCSGWIFNMET